MKYIIFERFPEVKVERPQKFGGDVAYGKLSDLTKDFTEGNLHPTDLKNATAFYVNELLKPVRKHFSGGKAKDLADFVKRQQTTR